MNQITQTEYDQLKAENEALRSALGVACAALIKNKKSFEQITAQLDKWMNE